MINKQLKITAIAILFIAIIIIVVSFNGRFEPGAEVEGTKVVDVIEVEKSNDQVVSESEISFSDTVSSESTEDELFESLVDDSVDDVLFYDEGINELGDYVEISDENIQSLIKGCKMLNSDDLSSEQLNEFITVAARDILGYKHGDPDTMLSNILKTYYTFNEDVVDIYRNKITKFHNVTKDEIPKEPEDVLRLYLMLNSMGENNRKNLYNEISSSGSVLSFHTTKEPPVKYETYLRELQESNIKILKDGYIAPNKLSVSYKNSVNNEIKTSGELLYVEARFVASDAQGKKYSRLKRYYWSSEDKTWLLMDWASLYSRSRQADEIF